MKSSFEDGHEEREKERKREREIKIKSILGSYIRSSHFIDKMLT